MDAATRYGKTSRGNLRNVQASSMEQRRKSRTTSTEMIGMTIHMAPQLYHQETN
jgi:hypothetical protein